MTDLESEMNRVVQGFVAQITEIAKRAVMSSLDNAFSRSNGRRGGLSLSRMGSVGRGRGVKRSSVELDKLQDKFFSFVKDNPGLRIEQINKQLGTSTKDLALPIRKLIADGEIKAKGEKRSTTYFASEGGRKKKKN
jgi:predicted HTH transcriptional regulator